MKIAIAGYGAEGRSNYNYFAAAGHDLTIVDERPELNDLPLGSKVILGEGAFSKLSDFDMVVRTAGLNPAKITTHGQIWSATNEFFAKCPAPIIGVTGSKGKGTTCSLIASILRSSGRTVHLVGNIGVPALDELAKIQAGDIVVYELSSFQLWDAQASPHIAAVVHIEPDHLDVHADFEEYIQAKANITRHQTSEDVFIYAPTNSVARQMAESSQARSRLYADKSSAWHDNEWFYFGDQKLCATSSLKLSGAHNLDNACAAIAAAWDYVQDGEIIAKGLSYFDGLPHRLKFVRELNGVSYYDDSIATTPGSAIAAVRAFNQPKVLILGGSSKGADFRELAEVLSQADMRAVLLIGDEAGHIAEVLGDAGVFYELLGSSVSMPDIVARAGQLSYSGDVVILSPACASFGMFKNYSDRGDQFIAAASAL